MVGELNKGFEAALYGVSLGRIYNSARAVGYGRWAIELALNYKHAKPSARTSRAIRRFFSPCRIRHKVACGTYGNQCATLLDQGQPAIKELSMTKAYSVQVGYAAVDQTMQTHGAMSFTNEIGLTEAWHALRIVNVADGTNEILNRTIAQRLLKEISISDARLQVIFAAPSSRRAYPQVPIGSIVEAIFGRTVSSSKNHSLNWPLAFLETEDVAAVPYHQLL